MEVDDDTTATTPSRTSCAESVLITSPFVEKKYGIVHYFLFWCYEEEREFAKNNQHQFMSTESIIMD